MIDHRTATRCPVIVFVFLVKNFTLISFVRQTGEISIILPKYYNFSMIGRMCRLLRELRSGIAGITKLSLLDYPGKMSAIIFLGGCNMACPFCHNSELVANNGQVKEHLSIETVLKYLSTRTGILEGVVITGGEPSLYNLDPLLEPCREMGYSIKIDTNGLRPESITYWVDHHTVDYIAMDIKNSAGKYATTCRLSHPDMSAIARSIDIIKSCGIDYEFRTTIIDPMHTPDDIREIGQELIPQARRYYLQPFVMRDTVPDQQLKEPSDDLLIQCQEAVKGFVQHVSIRGRDL